MARFFRLYLGKIKTITGIKKFKRIVIRSLLGLLLLLLLLGIALSLPPVQTRIGAYVTEILREDYGADIKVDQVAISVFGGVKLKKVLIRDHHKDTLIYGNRIQTHIMSFERLYRGQLIFGTINADGLLFYINTYKGENHTSLDRFISLFEDGSKPSGKKFLMKASEIRISNSHFRLMNYNREQPVDVDFERLDGRLKKFRVLGPEVTADIRELSFLDHRGVYVTSLTGDFLYDNHNIRIHNLDATTRNSLLKGEVSLKFNKSDFADFNNRVKFDVRLDQALLATNDIRYFYKEIGRDKKFAIKTHVTGTLNNLSAKGLKLSDDAGSHIAGDVVFKNLFNISEHGFYMKGKFSQVSSTYKDLVALLPNVLGKKLPSSMARIGNFNLQGSAEVSSSSIAADFVMDTSLGRIESDLVMTDIDNIDQAKYTGNIFLDNFNIGNFLEKRDLGIVSLDLDIDGQGFKQEYLNTSFSGNVYKIRYKNYIYTNILVNGDFKNPVFKGQLYVNDPNLFMDFKGSANLGRKDIAYDFEAKLDYANLKNMGWVKSDSVSVLKGRMLMDIRGNSIDDISGNIFVTEASYQNGRNLYEFEDISIASEFLPDGQRRIKLDAPDMASGEITGKYMFSQVRPMMENSLGSLYANYRPNKIKAGQFLSFYFSVNNKVADLFYPDLEIADRTLIDGKINSTNNEFKFNLETPKITAFKNEMNRIRVHIDNQHPIYNAQVEMDSAKIGAYKIADFSLFNVTSRDTLFMNSEFKGGKTGKDDYKLNFYHTITPEQDVVLGFLKSSVTFKDYVWYINEDEGKRNKILADRKLSAFKIDSLSLSNQEHKIALSGSTKGKDFKDLKLFFEQVQLDHITPELDGLDFNGVMDGMVSLKQNRGIYQPMADVRVKGLMINDIAMGELSLDVDGDDSFRKFYVNSVLENENFESFRADGEVDVSGSETRLGIDLKFDRFNLGTLNGLLAGDAISNIKGFASGTVNIDGTVNEPDVNGRLYADETSMTVPYLNVNYQMEDGSQIDVTEDRFIIPETGMTDTKYKTKGFVEGTIEHKKFRDWALDIKIRSERLLALDTEDSEDAAYYGQAFINGNATISGPTSALIIAAKATSEEGTSIKIPINSTSVTASRSYIQFLSPEEKYNPKKGITVVQKQYSGLELDLDFDLNQNAEVEVILDKNTGHGLKAKGNGNIKFGINTLGRFNMWGNYVAQEGMYNFKYGGIIDKKFKLKKGGTITWEGDPMRAVLNMEAVYSTTANPAILLENPSVNKKVPVEVVVGVRGNLTSPEPDFTINFPTVSSVLKSEIQYKLDDKDVRNTQALYLLSSGTFLSPEGVSQSDFAGNLFETASGLIGDIFQDPDSNINFAFDYQAADRRPGSEADGRVGVAVSTQVSDRISINGKVGVPVGGINESAIVGDVEIQYRVNDDGTLNLRVFNRENDITYLGQGIGYTQGIGFTYEVDFDTFRELVQKVFNVKVDLEKGTDVVPDSDMVPDGMHFTSPEEKKKKKQEKPKPNTEAVPSED